VLQNHPIIRLACVFFLLKGALDHHEKKEKDAPPPLTTPKAQAGA
jgi:hypothetical protein